MATREDRGQAQKSNVLILTASRGRRHGVSCRAIWKSYQREHDAEYRNEGRAWATAFVGVSMENVRWGRVNSLGLAKISYMNNFGGLSTMGVVPSCPSGPGVIKAEEYCLWGMQTRERI